MTQTTEEKIRILILSSRSAELTPAQQFLNKRNFDVTIKGQLRDGVTFLTQHQPSWVFLSINLNPTIEKYITLLHQSFKVEPILFADILDRNSMVRLEQCEGPILTSRLTGPSVLMRLHHFISDAPKGAMPKSQKTTGESKPTFGHIVLKGEVDHTARLDRIKAPDHASSVILPEAEKQLNTQLAKVTQALNAKTAPHIEPIEDVDRLNVMVWEEADLRGYLLMASSAGQVAASMEAIKLTDMLKSVRGNSGAAKKSLFGEITVDVKNFPLWAEMRSSMVKRHVSGNNEMLTCFVPEATPLPAVTLSPADKSKHEVKLDDIPTEVPLPCPLYIFLPQNDKYVCLIRADGHLSRVQQERLKKMGLPTLLLNNDDLDKFRLFYVREKLALSEKSRSSSAA